MPLPLYLFLLQTVQSYIVLWEIWYFRLIAQCGKKEEALEYLRDKQKSEMKEMPVPVFHTKESYSWSLVLCFFSPPHLLTEPCVTSNLMLDTFSSKRVNC